MSGAISEHKLEATFHIIGILSKHNIRIWGSEDPYAVIKHARDSPKVKFFAAISRMKHYGPVFFAEKNNVTGLSYLDMVKN